jgi:hypothetical protein
MAMSLWRWSPAARPQLAANATIADEFEFYLSDSESQSADRRCWRKPQRLLLRKAWCDYLTPESSA